MSVWGRGCSLALLVGRLGVWERGHWPQFWHSFSTRFPWPQWTADPTRLWTLLFLFDIPLCWVIKEGNSGIRGVHLGIQPRGWQYFWLGKEFHWISHPLLTSTCIWGLIQWILSTSTRGPWWLRAWCLSITRPVRSPCSTGAVSSASFPVMCHHGSVYLVEGSWPYFLI